MKFYPGKFCPALQFGGGLQLFYSGSCKINKSMKSFIFEYFRVYDACVYVYINYVYAYKRVCVCVCTYWSKLTEHVCPMPGESCGVSFRYT